jgi:hypothetical protein
MTALSLMPGKAAWRARQVQYYAGDWASIQTVLPEFDLKPFSAGQDEPPNPFLKTVMRKPRPRRSVPFPLVLSPIPIRSLLIAMSPRYAAGVS